MFFCLKSKIQEKIKIWEIFFFSILPFVNNNISLKRKNDLSLNLLSSNKEMCPSNRNLQTKQDQSKKNNLKLHFFLKKKKTIKPSKWSN